MVQFHHFSTNLCRLLAIKTSKYANFVTDSSRNALEPGLSASTTTIPLYFDSTRNLTHELVLSPHELIVPAPHVFNILDYVTSFWPHNTSITLSYFPVEKQQMRCEIAIEPNYTITTTTTTKYSAYWTLSDIMIPLLDIARQFLLIFLQWNFFNNPITI